MTYIKKKHISDREVAALMLKTLDHFGLSYPTHAELHSLFKDKIPMPIVKMNKDVEVWLDKEYIAYSYRDEPNAHYAFITHSHWLEEKKQRNNPIVANAFKLGKSIMYRNHEKFAIVDIIPPKDESKRELMRVDESRLKEYHYTGRQV